MSKHDGGATADRGKTNDRRFKILVVDDTLGIHNDFRKILTKSSEGAPGLDELEESLFGWGPAGPPSSAPSFGLDSAYQGQAGLEAVERALGDEMPYAVAFIDVRMPPGWDGIQTAGAVLRADPNIQVVVCTAHSDFSWEEFVRLGHSDRLLILKKPFDCLEVRQIAHALTKKWALGRERQQLLDSLSDRVSEQTHELVRANEQLKAAMAERLRVEKELRHSQKLEALGRLTAGIGHEINNPLAYLRANLDFLSHGLDALEPAPPAAQLTELREAISDAVQGVGRIKQIVQDIKGFARPDENGLGATSVRACFEAALRMASKELQHRARLIMTFDELEPVVADSRRLEQVFLNVLINAAHALPQGRASENEISVTTRAIDPTKVAVEIRDTGCGIDADDLERVFDPFFTTKPLGSGSGLGLSICQGIVRSFGGEISLESAVGRGTTVRILLRLAAGDARSTAPPPSGVAMKTGASHRDAARILIVDDDVCVLRSLKRLLSGFETHSAQSGRKALELYMSQTFDVVLCDLMMPDMGGIEVHQALCELGPAHAARLAFVTGGVVDTKTAELLAATGRPWLEKPFSVNELRALIRRQQESTAETMKNHG